MLQQNVTIGRKSQRINKDKEQGKIKFSFTETDKHILGQTDKWNPFGKNIISLFHILDEIMTLSF